MHNKEWDIFRGNLGSEQIVLSQGYNPLRGLVLGAFKHSRTTNSKILMLNSLGLEMELPNKLPDCRGHQNFAD